MDKKIKISIQLILLTLILLSTSINLLTAHDDDDDEDTFEVEQSGDKIKVKYEYEIDNDDIEYEIEYEVEVDIQNGRGLSIEIEYEEGDSNENFEIGKELEFNLEYLSLSEYTDTNNDDVYQVSSDVLVQTINLFQMSFNISLETINNTNGINSFVITAIGKLNEFEFGIVVFIYDSAINGISKNQAKIDIIINNFPFQTNDGKILLVAELDSFSEGKKFREDKANENAVEIDHPLGVAQYIVNRQVLIDGIGMTVNVYEALSSDKENAYSYTSYPHGDIILHDPVFGVIPQKTSSSPNDGNNNLVNEKKDNFVSEINKANSLNIIILSFSLISILIVRRKH